MLFCCSYGLDILIIIDLQQLLKMYSYSYSQCWVETDYMYLDYVTRFQTVSTCNEIILHFKMNRLQLLKWIIVIGKDK